MSFLSNMVVRSPWLFRLNAGSCNGCDVELATTAFIPRFDVERLGCKYCGSPRHADIVFITGPLTTRVKDKILRVWNEIPEPKVTIAVGICPISGGVFRGGHSIEGPLDRYIPIDVNVPGCPPRPQAIMESVILAKEIWLKRMNELENAARDPKASGERPNMWTGRSGHYGQPFSREYGLVGAEQYESGFVGSAHDDVEPADGQDTRQAGKE